MCEVVAWDGERRRNNGTFNNQFSLFFSKYLLMVLCSLTSFRASYHTIYRFAMPSVTLMVHMKSSARDGIDFSVRIPPTALPSTSFKARWETVFFGFEWFITFLGAAFHYPNVKFHQMFGISNFFLKSSPILSLTDPDFGKKLKDPNIT